MNLSMVNYILEHRHETEKNCSICHDEENPISKDNILVLNCCHSFHIECCIKAFIELDMKCPLCRNVHNFTWGRSDVYRPVILYVIDNKYYDFLNNFGNTIDNNDTMVEYAILTENIDALQHLNSLNDFETDFNLPKIIIENRKFEVMKWYAKSSVYQGATDDLLKYAIINSDMFAIMYLIYEFNADIYKDVGMCIVYAVQSKSVEIMSYLIHELNIDVHAYNNLAISTALSGDNSDIVRLCLENMADPGHPNNSDIKSELEDVVEHVRELIIQNAIQRLSGVNFSKIIIKTCIHSMNAVELFELLSKEIDQSNE